jgi:hypothetical protein
MQLDLEGKNGLRCLSLTARSPKRVIAGSHNAVTDRIANLITDYAACASSGCPGPSRAGRTRRCRPPGSTLALDRVTHRGRATRRSLDAFNAFRTICTPFAHRASPRIGPYTSASQGPQV